MKTILIMEDELRLATIWQLALEEAGYAVIVENNFEAASKALQESEVVLVICDMLIRTAPKFKIAARGGLSLLAFIQLHLERHLKPIVIVVSGADESLNVHKQAEAMQAAVAFKKPVDVDELLAKVDELLAGNS